MGSLTPRFILLDQDGVQVESLSHKIPVSSVVSRLLRRFSRSVAAGAKAAPENVETKASARLTLAKSLLEKDRASSAGRWLRKTIEEFPGTEAANEAALLLKTL